MAVAAAASACRFRFGMEWQGPNTLQDPHDYNGIDYITVWIGQNDGLGKPRCRSPPCFNPYWHGAALELARERGLSVAYYAYIIAFLAKATGLNDCDVGTPSLCQKGANYIRNNEAAILRTYAHFANETSRMLGSTAEVLWLIEPDWHQYHEGSQEGGGLTADFMVALYNRMTREVLRFLPSARFSLDISPWVNNQQAWIEPFIFGCQVDFLHTSGGRTTGTSERIRAHDSGNLVTWAQVHRASGKGIIADTGYGVGGRSMGHVASWDDEQTLRSRINDGLVAVTQAHPGYGWSDTLSYLRPRLSPPPLCTWHAPNYAPLPKTSDISDEVRSWRASTGYLAAAAVALALLCGVVVRIRRCVTGWLRQRAIRGIAQKHAPKDGPSHKSGRQAVSGARPRSGKWRGGVLPLSPSQVALSAARALEAQLDAEDAPDSRGAPVPRPRPKPKPRPRSKQQEETERLASGDVSGDVSDDGSVHSASGSVYSLSGLRAQGAPLLDSQPEVVFRAKGRSGRSKKPSTGSSVSGCSDADADEELADI